MLNEYDNLNSDKYEIASIFNTFFYYCGTWYYCKLILWIILNEENRINSTITVIIILYVKKPG